MVSKSVSFVNGISVFICILLWVIYLLVVNKQYRFLKEETLRLQVLSTRCAICLPIYSIVVVLSLIYPNAYYALEVPVAIFEGYSFYCYFALVVANLGGPDESVNTMRSIDKEMCCSCCCPADRAAVYIRTWWNEWHFIFTRTGIVLVSTIFYYLRMKAVFIILQVIAFAILVNGVMSVVNFYENVMNECSNLKGILKFLIIKVSVGLIVVQGIITEIVIALNKVTLKDNEEFTSDDRAIRLYLFITLLEYLILGTAMYFAFGAEILPSEKIKRAARSDAQGNNFGMTYWGFWKELLAFTDVFNTLALSENMSQSLVSNQA